MSESLGCGWARTGGWGEATAVAGEARATRASAIVGLHTGRGPARRELVEVVSGQGFAFEQGAGHAVEAVARSGYHPDGEPVGLLDQAADLESDDPLLVLGVGGGALRVRVGSVGVGDVAEGLTHSELADHAARDGADFREVVGCTGAGLVEGELFGHG